MKQFILLGAAMFFNFATASGLKNDCQVTLIGDYSQSEKFNVHTVVAPKTVEELRALVRTTHRPIAVRGAGFSMGGQTAARNGVVVEMKNLNQVVDFKPEQKTIRVQAGATWRDIQRVIDPQDLSVMIMQSYNNFQVGGSLSVNAHGRYIGYGPLIASVNAVRVMLADGSIVDASRTQNSDLFNGIIGGYAALGIVLEAELRLVDNHRLERRTRMFKSPDIAVAVREFVEHFETDIEKNPDAEMANADIYPPDYDTVASISFNRTEAAVTVPDRMQPETPTGWAALKSAAVHSVEQLSRWAKRLRARYIAPHDLLQHRVVYRNNEASYDNRELLPLNNRLPWLRDHLSISNRQALLQEYFIPKAKLPEFIAKMKNIFIKHKVNVSNVSLRHVPKNTESILSWSREDSFAVVVYYVQPYGRNADPRLDAAKTWTREIIAEVDALGGSFYLPYQVYATRDQFNHAYPRHQEFFALKRHFDPEGKFNNNLWEQYNLSADSYFYRDLLATAAGQGELKEYFRNIFSINDPERFVTAIGLAMANVKKANRDMNDRNVYEELLKVLPEFASGKVRTIAKTLSALRVQQQEMASETANALRELNVSSVNGYLEIGSPGRYVLPLHEQIAIDGPIHVLNDGFSPAHLVETSWGLRVPAVLTTHRLQLSNYDMIRSSEIPDQSLDLATMYIGLHHCPPEKLGAFVASIARVLRVGGKFVLRDHDANDQIRAMAFMAHSTYNAGLGIRYGDELSEIRNLHPLSYWKDLLAAAGFKFVGHEVHQVGDPTGNTLMVFEKLPAPSAPVGNFDLNLLPGYHRDQSNTYMTQAEWFLVDIFKELSNFMATAPWYEFPFGKFTKLYEEVYAKHRDFARHEGITDQKAFKEYEQMDQFLLGGIKALFKAMGFVAKFSYDEKEPREYVIRAQWFMADFFSDYSDFMAHTPWYAFDYKSVVDRFEEFSGHRTFAVNNGIDGREQRAIDGHLLRQAKLLLLGMNGAAKLVQKFLDEQTVDPHTHFVVKADDAAIQSLADASRTIAPLGNGLHVVRTDRYMPFTKSMIDISRTPIEVVNVAGNRHISVIFRSNSASLPALNTPVDAIMTYRYPTAELPGGCQDYFHTVRVAVGALPALLSEAPAAGLKLLRVHDF